MGDEKRALTIRRAPPGLLRTASGQLLFKSQYGDNDGHQDVFIVASGEYYCGEVQDRIKALNESCVPVHGDAPSRTFAERRDRESFEENLRGLLHVLPPVAAAKWHKQFGKDAYCHAGSDGECNWKRCPQERDHEPHTTGRHCPLDRLKEDEDG